MSHKKKGPMGSVDYFVCYFFLSFSVDRKKRIPRNRKLIGADRGGRHFVLRELLKSRSSVFRERRWRRGSVSAEAAAIATMPSCLSGSSCWLDERTTLDRLPQAVLSRISIVYLMLINAKCALQNDVCARARSWMKICIYIIYINIFFWKKLSTREAKPLHSASPIHCW